METTDIEKINKEIESLLKKQQELSDKISTITSELDAYKTKTLTNRGLVENVSKKNSADISEMRFELNETKEKTKDNIESFNSFKRQQDSDNIQVNAEIDRINATVTTIKNSNNDLVTRTNTMSTKLTTLENNVYSGNNSRVINAEKDIAALKNSLDTYNLDLTDSFKNLSSKYKIDVDKINTRIDNIKTDVSSFKNTQDINIQALTNKLNFVDSKFSNYYNKIQSDNLIDTCFKKTGGNLSGNLIVDKNYSTIGNINNNKFYRIKGMSESNKNYLEIAISNEGSESIVVRQYKNPLTTDIDAFQNVYNEAYLLNENGDTTFPHTVSANLFNGNIKVGGRVNDLSNAIVITASDKDKYENTFYINNIYNASNAPRHNIFYNVDYGNLMTIRGQFISQVLFGSNGLGKNYNNNDITNRDCSVYYRHMRDVNSRYSDWSRFAFSHEPIVGDSAIFNNDNINFDTLINKGAYNITEVWMNGTNNRPNDIYRWGIMNVVHSIDPTRNVKDVLQIYYPHAIDPEKKQNRVSFRVGHANTTNMDYRFSKWQYLVTQDVLDEALADVSVGLKRNTQYNIGDVLTYKFLPSWARLECVASGTTASTITFDVNNIRQGDYIVDGTTRWIIDDIRDGTKIGSVIGSLYLPDGYALANGALVNRRDYPRLVALANKYNLWTSNTNGNLGLFGVGDGNLTMNLPNWMGRMMQFMLSDAGRTVAPGLPNITGGLTFYEMIGGVPSSGVFSTSNEYAPRTYRNGGGGYHSSVSFDASRSNNIYGSSNTVQPASIIMLPCIRY